MVTMTQNNSILMPKIALYEPDIPQNTASIIRTCSCLGVFLEIIEPCGFIISDKSASSNDIEKLIDYIQKKVYEEKNIFLETEVKFVGNNI